MRKPFVRRVLLSAMIITSCCLCAAGEDPDQILAHAKTLYSEEGARKALPEYEKALAAYQSAGNRLGEAITSGLIGNCYKKLGDYPKALDFLNRALSMKRELHARLEEGKTLSNLGLVYWERGEYPNAIQHFNESIAIALEVHDLQLEASATNNLALVYDEEGEYRKALELYQKALSMQRANDYEPGEGDALGNIGGVYLSLGKFEECESFYRQALDIDHRLELKPRETLDVGNAALCQFGQGKIDEALSRFDTAEALAKESGMAKQEADWARAKASALLRTGQVDAALKGYDRSSRTYTQAGLKREESEVLMDLGSAYFMLGDIPGAKRSILQAIKIADDIGYVRGQMQDRLSLAEVLISADQSQHARAEALAALRKAKQLGALDGEIQSKLTLAKIALAQHSYSSAAARAEDCAARAHSSGLRLLEGESLSVVGDLLVQRHDPAQALNKLESAKAIATETGDVDLEWQAEYHLGQGFEMLHQHEEAVRAYREAIETIEGVRTRISERRFRTGYFQNKQRVYVSLVSLLVRMGKDGEAFGFSERLREFSFQQFRGEVPIGPDPRIAQAKARIWHLQKLLENENDKPDSDRRGAAARTYSEEILAAQSELRTLIDSTAPVPATGTTPNALQSIQRALPMRTALLEYVVNERELLVFAMTSSSLHSLRISVQDRDLRSKVGLLRDLISDEKSGAWQKPAESLRAILVSPLEKRGWLRGISSLLIVPHGALNELPFAALPIIRGGNPAFLIEQYEVLGIPSGSWLLKSWQSAANNEPRVLALAPGNSKLKFAVAEAQSVAKTFGPSSVALTGVTATETRFKRTADRYDFIHIATHGFFNSSDPIISGLQLEPDAQNDGRLEVDEILTLKLKARLVTLSACDTALASGDFANVPAGDEFIGLSRAFLEAGGQGVLASLWKVDDLSTEVLMRRFYRTLRNREASEALAMTQRSMIRTPQYSHPFFWAAFVLIGGNLSNSQLLAEKR